jgi:membrane-associated phospholipid phosphatase
MNEDVLDRFKGAPVVPEPGLPGMAFAPSVSTDQILYWNAVALEADRVSHTIMPNEQPGPVLSSRALAIVHLAMYDAYAGDVGNLANLPAYLPGLPAPPPGASAAAAIAAAARTALSALYPSQRSFFESAHRNAGLSGGGLNDGHTFGLRVARRMLADRHDDPSVSDIGYVASPGRGAHRVDPDNPDPSQRFYAPFYGAQSKGFAITARHELAAPPFDNAEYLAALRQVREKGIAPKLIATLPPGSSPRTPAETLIGIFWAYDGAIGLGTPPRLYNQIVREVAKAQGNTVAENARLFALVNAALADAGILAWDQKYLHDFWRPVVGVREHDLSIGPTGTGKNAINPDGDLFWLPLGAPRTNGSGKNFTPNFPAYPSGHATFGAAALHITRLFYGWTGRCPDDLFHGLSFVSEEFNGVNRDVRGTVRPRHARSFPDGLWGMILENAFSRILLGVHWVFDAYAVDDNGNPDLNRKLKGEPIGGVPLGLKIAEDIFAAGDGKAPKKSTVPPRS